MTRLLLQMTLVRQLRLHVAMILARLVGQELLFQAGRVRRATDTRIPQVSDH